MKSLLVYYSHYGNTAVIANEFLDALSKKGDVDVAELRYLGGRKNIFARAFYRLFPSLVALEPITFNPKDYDVLCLGLPVWGGRPSAPIAKYLNNADGVANKQVICFFVYGLEASAKACFSYVKKILEKKGAAKIIEVYVPWEKVHQREFLDQQVNQVLEKVAV